MSARPRLERMAVVALGLVLLLAADPMSLPSGRDVTAASGSKGSSRTAGPDAAGTSAAPESPGTAAGPEAAGITAPPESATGSPAPAIGTDPAGTAPVCIAGFGDTDSRLGLSLLGVTQTGRGALAVGFVRAGQSDEMGQRRPAAMIDSDSGWTRVRTASPGVEDGLVAVTSAGDGKAWAVGFTTIRGLVMPLAMRWDGRSWKVKRPRPVGRMTSLFTAVAMVDDSPFAVGYRMLGNGGSQPIAARLAGERWRYVNPRTRARESMILTGVASDARDGLWVVGHGGRGTEVAPVIFRRRDGGWTRQKVPRLAGEAVLTDVVATARNDAWAVGYQQLGGRTLPLTLHWDGRTWSRAPAPSLGSEEVVLAAVTASPSGGVWVVGSAWNEAIKGHEAVAAWWDGQAWNEVAGTDGGTELHDAVGSLDTNGWAVGRSGLRSSTVRVCLPPQSGIFGGSEPTPLEPDPARLADAATGPLIADTGRTADDPGAATGDRGAVTGTSGAVAGTSGQAATDDPSTALATTPPDAGKREEAAAAASTAPVARKKRPRSRSKASQQRRATRLPPARAFDHLVARDVAVEAGVFEQTATYGAVVADFDGDGVDDLYIGRHGRPARLLLDRDGVFVDHEAMQFPSIDRHGCTAADIDGSGLPDLYCAVGGKRGSGLKSNELWLDPGGPNPLEVAVERGVSDPTGRGRRAVFLETEGSSQIDLVVTNSPTRVDGLPSIGQLYRTSGDGTFSARTRTGFAARLGSLTTKAADFDGDGREDLLLVTGGPQAPRQEGTHLYRATPRGLVDVTRRMGIRSFGEIDAELADVDGDGKLDLVQLSPTRLRVSRLKDGRFRKVYERRLAHGRAITSGDANGDGRDDLYVVRSNGGRNVSDVMLINRKAGRAWASLRMPQVRTGDGDDVVAIDHDGNGLEDFVVLNGRNRRGPTQLIALYRQ